MWNSTEDSRRSMLRMLRVSFENIGTIWISTNSMFNTNRCGVNKGWVWMKSFWSHCCYSAIHIKNFSSQVQLIETITLGIIAKNSVLNIINFLSTHWNFRHVHVTLHLRFSIIHLLTLVHESHILMRAEVGKYFLSSDQQISRSIAFILEISSVY